MAKAGELDWGDLMKGDVGEPESHLSRPLNTSPNRNGDKITKSDLNKEACFILDGFNQPHLKSPSKDEFEKALSSMIPEGEPMTDEDWNNAPNKAFESLKASKVQDRKDDLENFGKCMSFNDALTHEELEHRNMFSEE